MAIVTCPNCKTKIHIKRKKNRWVEWFEGYCNVCGYNFKLKDREFDFVQPSNPLFKEIYKHHPREQFLREKKQKELKKEKEKAELEKKYSKMVKEKKLKPWEEKDIKKTILEEKGW